MEDQNANATGKSARFALSTAGLSARDRGRVQKHLDTLVRYMGRLHTYREVYDQHGTRVEYHPNATKSADRYRLVLDTAYGAYLRIPKMIYDAALRAELLGADVESEPQIHPSWEQMPGYWDIPADAC
jgi:hypothetical protein